MAFGFGREVGEWNPLCLRAFGTGNHARGKTVEPYMPPPDRANREVCHILHRARDPSRAAQPVSQRLGGPGPRRLDSRKRSGARRPRRAKSRDRPREAVLWRGGEMVAGSCSPAFISRGIVAMSPLGMSIARKVPDFGNGRVTRSQTHLEMVKD